MAWAWRSAAKCSSSTRPNTPQISGTTIKAVDRRVPVIINTGAAGTDLAVFYSRATEALGADALMVIPPSFNPVSADEIFDYYRAESMRRSAFRSSCRTCRRGRFRRASSRCASPMPARTCATSRSKTQPVTAKVHAMSEAAGKRLTIFGGAGGSYFIEEMRRGAHGTMPFCSQPADFVAVWDAFQAGDEAATRRARFDATIMAINRLGNQGGDIFYGHPQAIADAPWRHPQRAGAQPYDGDRPDHPARDRRAAGQTMFPDARGVRGTEMEPFERRRLGPDKPRTAAARPRRCGVREYLPNVIRTAGPTSPWTRHGRPGSGFTILRRGMGED